MMINSIVSGEKRLTRHSPACPDAMDWSEYYPAFSGKHRNVEIADIGCGYGGLLFALSSRFPDTLILGKSPLLLLFLEFIQVVFTHLI